MTQLLPESTLASFHAVASREFERAAEHHGRVDRRLRFVDRTVLLRFAGARLAGVLLGALAAREDNSDGAPDDRTPDAVVSLWEADDCPGGSVPFPWRWSNVGTGGLIRETGDGRLVAVHETCSGTLTLIDRTASAMLYRVPHTRAVPWWERAAPLRPCLFWALAGDGGHLVHAAAVGDDRGAVLLVGARGSGKTTVAMAAVNHGLRFVADDYLLLRSGHTPEAVALYNTVSVAASSRTASAGDTKAVLDLRKLMPDALCESLTVRAVVVPCVSEGRTQLRRVTPVAALRAWAPTTVFQMPFDDGAVVATLAGVVSSCPCYSLDVGSDEADLADAVLQVLEQVVS
ncbi:MAG: hypothetical protein ACRD0Z_17125 [Acidimicrobiales bacterium]